MKNLVIITIKIYQKLKDLVNLVLLSILGLAFSCRQNPSCSQYAVDQHQKKGIITGLKRALFRTISCY